MSTTRQPPEHSEYVEASLNFLGEMAEPPASYAYDPPPGEPRTNIRIARQTVRIHNARRIAERLSLDREGFALIRRPSAVRNFYDEDEIRTVYYPECERLVLKETGAARVVVFDHIVRCATRSRAGEKAIKEPAKGVHNDYTVKSGPQRVRDLLPGEADALLKSRFAVINVWRPISRPVEESPLAVCDAQSIPRRDFVPHARIYPDRRGEIYAVRFSPAHRWYYVPSMRPDEALLLKCYDSLEDGRARFTAHTAFDDPTSSPNALARESIEVRALVFFAPDGAPSPS
jgi:hypothetical protein